MATALGLARKNSDFVEKDDEFFALDRVCRSISKRKIPAPWDGTGACFSCKRRASWVLGLHSCRALSPQSQPHDNRLVSSGASQTEKNQQRATFNLELR